MGVLGITCLVPGILSDDWVAELFKEAVNGMKMTSETKYELIAIIDHHMFSMVIIGFGAVCLTKAGLGIFGVILKSQIFLVFYVLFNMFLVIQEIGIVVIVNNERMLKWETVDHIKKTLDIDMLKYDNIQDVFTTILVMVIIIHITTSIQGLCLYKDITTKPSAVSRYQQTTDPVEAFTFAASPSAPPFPPPYQG